MTSDQHEGEIHKHNWAEPGLWTVDSRNRGDFRWCIICGTLHYYGIEHQPADHNAAQKLDAAIEALERIRLNTNPPHIAYRIADTALAQLRAEGSQLADRQRAALEALAKPASVLVLRR